MAVVATTERGRPVTRAIQMSLFLPMWLLPGCTNLDPLKCDLGVTAPGCPAPTPFVWKTCSQLTAAAFHWSIGGFGPQDVLNPDVRNQPTLTVIMHVGDVKALKVSAGSTETNVDCGEKATSVEWSVADPRVARLDVADNPRAASLAALEPGDTVVAATLQFGDGTPPMRVFPWSFTNVGSGDITVVRVVP
jgi:hypothetical protein